MFVKYFISLRNIANITNCCRIQLNISLINIALIPLQVCVSYFHCMTIFNCLVFNIFLTISLVLKLINYFELRKSHLEYVVCIGLIVLPPVAMFLYDFLLTTMDAAFLYSKTAKVYGSKAYAHASVATITQRRVF